MDPLVQAWTKVGGTRPGLAVSHRIPDGTPGLGSYFIDDCVCVVWCGPVGAPFHPCWAGSILL